MIKKPWLNILIIAAVFSITFIFCQKKSGPPNIIFIFADEWRAQAAGYMGNKDVKTPNLDALAAQSVVFSNAVSGCPVCSPYRASLLTGQYPLTHGVFYNDKPLNTKDPTMAEIFSAAGYNTAYIGKWHVNGHSADVPRNVSRQSPVPLSRRRGFDYWKVCECTHDYNNSLYFDENNEQHFWDGYDAIAQTREAEQFIIKSGAQDKPFILLLSWGPPHDPYHTAPQKYEKMYEHFESLSLRANVPEEFKDIAREKLSGYYAHITALDDCIGSILETIRKTGIASNTILVFTSDHGEMLYSQGMTKKQKPWDESILVPFMIRYPELHGSQGFVIKTPLNTPDILPTLLGLSGLTIPETIEGEDLSATIMHSEEVKDKVAFLQFPVPFHQWNYRVGGKEYRGIRTSRYTYVRDLKGPWLLYDNQTDPYQLNNLTQNPEAGTLLTRLDRRLEEELNQHRDEFLTGPDYMKLWNYGWDENDEPGADIK